MSSAPPRVRYRQNSREGIADNYAAMEGALHAVQRRIHATTKILFEAIRPKLTFIAR